MEEDPLSVQRRRAARIGSGLLALATVGAGVVIGASPAYAAAVPTITALSSAVGSTAGGTALGSSILITGTGLSTVSETATCAGPAMCVKFGTTAVAAGAISVISDTTMAVKVPASIATPAADTGLVDIIVTNATGPSVASTKSKFAVRAPLTAAIAANVYMNPIAGSVLTVPITGYTLGIQANYALEKITATVNGVAAVTAWGSTSSVKVTVPAGTPSSTAATVALFHDGIAGTNDTTHAFYTAVITALSRTSGPIAGAGGDITVTGKGLGTGAVTFYFGVDANTAACTVAAGGLSALCLSAVIPKTPVTVTGPPAVDMPTTVPVYIKPTGSVTFGYTAGNAYTYTNLT